MGKGVIHPSAIIDPSAELAPDVQVGPYCIIGEDVHIGEGSILHANVHIISHTRIGINCQIFNGAVIGGPPQDYKYKHEMTFVELGDNNIIREFVTIHRATGEGNATRIGSNNMIMAYGHIAHNCEIGDRVVIASFCGIAGHVSVQDGANLGGHSGIHQFSRIGTMAMVGGMAGVNQDVPPYMLATGFPARVCDVNMRALRRAGIAASIRGDIRTAYKLLYRSNLNRSQALEAIADEIEPSPEIEHLLNFVRHTREGINGRGNTI